MTRVLLLSREVLDESMCAFVCFFPAQCYASAAYVVVCVYICLSRSWILSKKINVSSKFLHRRVANPFKFSFHTKRHDNIPTGSPPPLLTGATNAGGIGRNLNSEPICPVLPRAINAATGQVLSTRSRKLTLITGSKQRSYCWWRETTKGGFSGVGGWQGCRTPKMPSQHNSENCTSYYMYMHKNGMLL